MTYQHSLNQPLKNETLLSYLLIYKFSKLTKIMEYICILCKKCPEHIPSNQSILMTYDDDDDIIRIIISNYITRFEICEHYKKDLNKILHDNFDSDKITTTWHNGMGNMKISSYCHITNEAYSDLNNKFLVIRNNQTFQLVFRSYIDNYKKIYTINEFLSTIKNGTLLFFPRYDLRSKLDKILFEHNTGFTTRKIKKQSETIYIIDAPTLTKSALIKK